MAIEPTVGSILWYYPAGHAIDTEPMPAIVTQVHSATCVNLCAFVQTGYPLSPPPLSVRLVQPGEEIPDSRTAYCRWMPYLVVKPG